eukprot:3318623-Rhodomonas_salina.1
MMPAGSDLRGQVEALGRRAVGSNSGQHTDRGNGVLVCRERPDSWTAEGVEVGGGGVKKRVRVGGRHCGG